MTKKEKLNPLKVIKNEESETPNQMELKPPPIYVIDWDKVVSIEDIKIILKELNLSVDINRATEDIKPFLKQVT